MTTFGIRYKLNSDSTYCPKLGYSLHQNMSETSKRLWTREELVVTLSLYFQLPFGRLNHTTPEVRELAAIIGRTESSVALRLVNFAACDPYILETGRHGMESGVKVCKPIWDEYYNDKQKLFFDAENIKAKMLHKPIEEVLRIQNQNFTGQERIAEIKQRVNQSIFRAMILGNYNEQCAITGINHPSLLIASHIIPWAADEKERLNPENGICLSALYDKAFDQGLITIRHEDYTVKVSKELKDRLTIQSYNENFRPVENKKIILPEEHKPSKICLQYHEEHVFKSV